MEALHRHLWQYRWVRDLIVLAALAACVWLAVAARTVTVPFLVGLLLAYAAHPLVRWMQRRLRLPRLLAATLLLFALVASFAGVLLYVLPGLLHQSQLLAAELPAYTDRLLRPLGLRWEDVVEGARLKLGGDPGHAEPMDVQEVGRMVWRWLGVGLGLVTTVVGTTVYALTAILLGGFTFVWFAAHMDRVWVWFAQLIPAERRDTVVRIASRMDRSVAGNLRGRLLQSLLLAIELCIGWNLLGLKYWLLLGVVVGLMNVVPFLSLLGAPLVIALHWADRQASGVPFTLVHDLVGPLAVHAIGQFIDGWIVEPLVQGRVTQLHAMTVMLAVMVGGTLFGVLGMLLAVPVAAVVKILLEELLVPALKTWLSDVSSSGRTTPGNTGP